MSNRLIGLRPRPLEVEKTRAVGVGSEIATLADLERKLKSKLDELINLRKSLDKLKSEVEINLLPSLKFIQLSSLRM